MSAVLGVVVIVLGGALAPGPADARVAPIVRFHGVHYGSPGIDDLLAF